MERVADLGGPWTKSSVGGTAPGQDLGLHKGVFPATGSCPHYTTRGGTRWHWRRRSRTHHVRWMGTASAEGSHTFLRTDPNGRPLSEVLPKGPGHAGRHRSQSEEGRYCEAPKDDPPYVIRQHHQKRSHDLWCRGHDATDTELAYLLGTFIVRQHGGFWHFSWV